MTPEEIAAKAITGTAFVHLIHFWGFAMAVGASLAALKVHSLVRTHEAGAKKGLEEAGKALLTKLEIPGLFLALTGGIIAIMLNPDHLRVSASGAGPWLHIKLVGVLALLVVAHLRMFRASRLVRERAAGATEADLDALLGQALMFGKVDVLLTALIFILATFRAVFFG